MYVDGDNKRVFHRLGGIMADTRQHQNQKKVCFHWQAGKCHRHPCPFLHIDLPPSTALNGGGSSISWNRNHRDNNNNNGFSGPCRSSNFNGTSTWGRGGGGNRVVRKADKVCNYWVQRNVPHRLKLSSLTPCDGYI